MQRWNQPQQPATALLGDKLPVPRKPRFSAQFDRYTLSVMIRPASTPAKMKNSPMAEPVAFHVGHLLNRLVRSAFVEVGGALPSIHLDLGPGDERKCAENLGLNLEGDIEILILQ